MEDSNYLMVNNSINRYNLGSLSNLTPNADGSVDIYFGPKPPPGKEEKERQKAVDDAYRSAMEKLPDKKKSADPWEGVRSAPSRQGKK